MSYISGDRQERIELPYVTNASELGFVVNKVAEELLWKKTGYDWSKLTLEDIALVTGALTIAAAEFGRRITAEFHDRMLQEHGDIFTFQVDEPAAPMDDETLALAQELMELGAVRVHDEPQVPHLTIVPVAGA